MTNKRWHSFEFVYSEMEAGQRDIRDALDAIKSDERKVPKWLKGHLIRIEQGVNDSEWYMGDLYTIIENACVESDDAAETWKEVLDVLPKGSVSAGMMDSLIECIKEWKVNYWKS